MSVLALVLKSLLATMLILAGSAKLADLANFATVVRLFLPAKVMGAYANALGLALAACELCVGICSLAIPARVAPNVAVTVLAGHDHQHPRGHARRAAF